MGARRFVPCLVAFGSWTCYAATVGIALSTGRFLVDGQTVVGTATLEEGSRIETEQIRAEIRLLNGLRMWLLPGSSVTVTAGRVSLLRGGGEWEGSEASRVEVNQLVFVARGNNPRARVLWDGSGRIQALGISGELMIMKKAGPLIARAAAGRAFELELGQPAQAEPPFEMTGCLERRDGRYVLTDAVAGVTEELVGAGLEREVGNLVEVRARSLRGAKPTVEGASEVIEVLQLRRIRRGCPPPPAPGQVPAPEVRPGMSGATKAVIAGVTVGAAGAGAAVYLMRREEEKKGTISP